ERLRRAMVGDVAHELRTPLASVRGWLEAAQDGLTPTDRRLVDSLHEEALHLQHLVADLQDLALADAGELRLHREQVGVAALLDQVVRGHGAVAAAKGVRLEVSADPATTLDADPLRLRQAVTNLVANAIRHTPSGGTVTVAGRHAGDAVVVEVRDTGEGIAAADLPHVFERFWRADRSRTRGTGGSGLGLAIVRQVAELHGGTVTAASEPAQGSTFRLTLPMP
ncbi:MAG: HAMP domain-containing histidine kinase, partial [Promicromonosporaceae bacterium]|nr:HAMP domain-containing histidine kinase [Promicromonosporaceae bacterium]